MTDREKPILSLRSVRVTLGKGANRVHALDDIDLELMPGELVAVTGRSGSGKSTLLNVAGGLVDASTGIVEVEGVSLFMANRREKAELRRRSVGVVFQDLNLLPTLTSVENVSLPLELDGMAAREARRLADAALDDVELGELGGRFPDELSGGQRQRVAIARAFVGGRRLLLADEPTGALDEVTAESVMKLLRRRCDDGAATLLVTHDPSQAAWADRVVRLRDGRIDSVSERSATAAQLESRLDG